MKEKNLQDRESYNSNRASISICMLIILFIIGGTYLILDNEENKIIEINIDENTKAFVEDADNTALVTIIENNNRISDFSYKGSNEELEEELKEIFSGMNNDKSFFHSDSKQMKKRSLYIPRKPYQDRVRICVNATNFSEIGRGCGEEKNENTSANRNYVTAEYTLHLNDERLKLTEDKKFFIVKNIEGTGGIGEGDWWNDSYDYRRNINITGNISVNYTIEIVINANELMSENKINQEGSDLRVVYWNGTKNIEIDRFNASGFDETNTLILFKIQEEIKNTSFDYYFYYGNKNSGIAPDDKEKIYYLFEDFEDQSHDFTDGSLNPIVNSGSARNGNYGLEGDGTGGYRRAVKQDTLSRGMSIEGWVYSGYAGDNADLPGLEFGMQASERNGYQVILDWRSSTGGSSDIQIRKDYDSGSPLDTSTENTITEDTWYYIKAIWSENGDINSTIYDSNMNVFGTLYVNDLSYSQGYYGVSAYRDGFWDDVAVRIGTSSDVKYNLFEEEKLGPAINELHYENNTYRFDYINIISNVTTQKNMSFVWINITLPNASIQTRFLSNISSIYNISYRNYNVGEYNAILFANDSSGKIESTEFKWNVFGWVGVSEINISEKSITQGEGLNILCKVIDKNTSEGLKNYSVNLYSNESGLLTIENTNLSGWASYEYNDVTIGYEKIICNISDSEHYLNDDLNAEEIFNTSKPEKIKIIEANLNKEIISFGNEVEIYTKISTSHTIDKVIINLTLPDDSVVSKEMTNISSNEYTFIFNRTWLSGNYSFVVFANDSDSESDIREVNNAFELTSDISFNIGTDSMIYTYNEIVNLKIKKNDWFGGYDYRKQINITTNGSILKENFTLEIKLNTQELINSGKLKNNCDDIRIIYFDGFNNELDRVVDNCNETQSRITFKIKEQINESSLDYYIYYGNSNSIDPPEDKKEIYLLWDDFESEIIGSIPDGWIEDPEILTNNFEIVDDSGNKVLQDLATDGAYHRIWKGASDWNDYRIDARMKMDSFLFSGITFRRQDWSDSYYDHYAMISDDRNAGNKLVLRRWTGGGSSYAVLTGDGTDFEGLNWQNFTIESIGDTVRMFRNGIEYIDYDITSSNPAYSEGGFVGLMSHTGLTMFDDIRVMYLVKNDPIIEFFEEEDDGAPSILLNNGENVSFYLDMIVENNNSGSWKTRFVVLNGSNIINVENQMDLNALWNANGKWNTSLNQSGIYRIKISIKDENNIPLIDNEGNEIFGTTEFMIYYPGPEIILTSPIENSGSNNLNIGFEFNVTDEVNINSCELIINNETKFVEESIGENVRIDYLFNSIGGYNWKIKCMNELGSESESEERKISIIKLSNFSGRTTDLNNLNIENITNLLIENDNGLINFTEIINLSGGADFNDYVTIGDNLIEIDSENIQQLNKTAILTLKDVMPENPVILKNLEFCGDCSIISNKGDLTFSVQGFSNYSASENSQLNIWDDSDLEIKYPGRIKIFANYSNRTSGEFISGTNINCSIEIEGILDQINFNGTTNLYEYYMEFGLYGSYYYNITCNDSNDIFTDIKLEDHVFITNNGGPQIANVTKIKSERYEEDIIGQKNAQGGWIDSSNVQLNSQTESWQLFYGNISASIVLQNDISRGFEWEIIDPEGEILLSRSPSINFFSLNCSNISEISDEEAFIGQSSDDSDSVRKTFMKNNHPEIEIGGVIIPANTCNSTNLYISNSTQDSKFYEIILNDNNGDIVYTSVIENNEIGFNDGQYDYQILVGTKKEQVSDYYFFVEID